MDDVFVQGSFVDEDAAVAAVAALRERAYLDVRAASPFPARRLEASLEGDRPPRFVAVACACGGAVGIASGYGLQWWITVRALPLDVGGRPLHAAPAFVVLTWVTLVLCAAVATFASFFVGCRLPSFTGPLADVDVHARGDRFVLLVVVPARYAARARDDLAAAGAQDVR